MTYSLVGSALTHWKEHWPLYVGFTAAFWAYIIYKFALRVRFFSGMKSVPGPPHGHWFLGQIKAITGEAPGMAHLRWHRQYGNVIRIPGPLPGLETISFTSYTALKTIMVDRAYEFPKPPFLKDVLGIAAGYGLLTMEGSEHQALRRFMNPAFAFKYLHEQFETYYKPINSLVEILGAKCDEGNDEEKKEGKVVEISHYLNNCLMDIICLTAFGYECDSLHNDQQPLANAYHSLVNLQSGRNMVAFFALMTVPLGPFLARRASKNPRGGRILASLDRALGSHSPLVISLASILFNNLYTVNQIAKELLKEKLAEAKELKKAGSGSTDGGKIDVFSLLVRASLDENSPYKMDAEMMQYQMLTFLGAGHETTASGMSWAIWELSSRPEIQSKLRKECQELVARNSNPGYQDIKQLRYLHCFIQEVLRLRPPTPATAREASQNCTVDGIYIPKGTAVYIPNRCINQDKNIWGEDADEFKPERWLELPEKYDANFSLFTFIAGPHHCIGRNMSLLEMKAMLCCLISNFEFIQAQDLPKETSAITMKPDGGLLVKIRKLDPADSIKAV